MSARNGAILTTYGRDPEGNIVEIQEILSPDIPFLFRDLKVGRSTLA